MITDLCIMGYSNEECRMEAQSLHEGIDVATVREKTDFSRLLADPIGTTPAPTDEELRVLREEVDPYKCVIGR